MALLLGALLTASAHASQATLLTSKFAAMNGPGWTGADAAWSARLPDGRTAWLFGDTFIGGVSADGRRDPGAPLVRNSMVVDELDGKMRTFAGGSQSAPEALVPGDGDGDWYWPGPPVAGRELLQVPMARIARTGSGDWDFAATGTSLAEFDLHSLRLRDVVPLATPPGVNMASAALTTGGFTYVYGTQDAGSAEKQVFVARVAAGDLRRPWSYWTGLGWSADSGAAVSIAHGVSNQFSVIRAGKRWALITQVPLSNDIVAFSAPAPEGPWTRNGTIARIPRIPNAMTYNAIVHSEYSRGRTLTVGYCVNAASEDLLFTDASLYRPRFMSVRLPRLDAPGRTRGESAPARNY